MKKQLFKILVLTLITFSFSANLEAQVWNADANSGSWQDYFRLFQSDRCSGSINASVTTENNVDGTSGRSWKIRSPRNVRRAEFSRTTGNSQSFTHQRGKNFYYSWRWRIDSDATINDDVTVFQWKTENNPNITGSDGSQNYPINMEYNNGQLKLYYFAPCKINNQFSNWGNCKKPNGNQEFPSDRKRLLKSVSVAENQWVDIVLRIQRGENESGTGAGKVQLWINGSLQSLTGPNGTGNSITLKTDDANNNSYDDDTVYPKWGVYNNASCRFDITTWIHNLKIYDNHTAAVNNLKDSSPSASSPSDNWSNIASGWYRISPESNTNQALTVSNGNLIQYSWQGSNNQKFYVQRYTDGTYTIKTSDNKVLDVVGGSTSNGTNVVAWGYNGGTNQFWKFQDGRNGFIGINSKLNLSKGLAISGASTSNNANVLLWDFIVKNNHLFKFTGTSAPGSSTSGSSGGGSNIAQGKPSGVSSTYGSGYEGWRSNDGNSNTRWASSASGATTEQSVYYDLGADYNISSVRLYFENAYSKNFNIQIGVNGYWENVTGLTNNSSLSPGLGINRTARWIRFVSTNHPRNLVSIWEFEVLGTYAGKKANGKGSENVPLEPIGLNDITSKDVKVFPNPANSTFNIKLQGFKKADITISDLLGKTVYKSSTTNNEINLTKGNTFKTGIYIIRVTDTQNKTFINKLVIK